MNLGEKRGKIKGLVKILELKALSNSPWDVGYSFINPDLKNFGEGCYLITRGLEIVKVGEGKDLYERFMEFKKARKPSKKENTDLNVKIDIFEDIKVPERVAVYAFRTKDREAVEKSLLVMMNAAARLPLCNRNRA